MIGWFLFLFYLFILFIDFCFMVLFVMGEMSFYGFHYLESHCDTTSKVGLNPTLLVVGGGAGEG